MIKERDEAYFTLPDELRDIFVVTGCEIFFRESVFSSVSSHLLIGFEVEYDGLDDVVLSVSMVGQDIDLDELPRGDVRKIRLNQYTTSSLYLCDDIKEKIIQGEDIVLHDGTVWLYVKPEDRYDCLLTFVSPG